MSGLGESGLDVVGLRRQGHGSSLIVDAVLVLDLLLVVGDQGFLLDVAVVLDRRHAVLEIVHIGDGPNQGFDCRLRKRSGSGREVGLTIWVGDDWGDVELVVVSSPAENTLLSRWGSIFCG